MKEDLDQIIEKGFRLEPDYQLSLNFAQKVVARIEHREQLRSDLLEYLYLTGVLIGLLAVAAGIYYFIDKAILVQIFAFVSGNFIQVGLIVFLLNFIFFADRVLLRLLFNRIKSV